MTSSMFLLLSKRAKIPEFLAVNEVRKKCCDGHFSGAKKYCFFYLLLKQSENYRFEKFMLSDKIFCPPAVFHAFFVSEKLLQPKLSILRPF